MTTATIQQLANLGAPVVSRPIMWNQLVQRSWGDEFKAPDHGIYEFSGGRKYDSTDTGNTGIYNPNLGPIGPETT